MKKIGLMSLLLLFCAVTSRGQSCDCTITPFKPVPPCFEFCTSRLLSNTSLEELVYIIGVKEESARRIVDERNKSGGKSLEEYRRMLGPDEFQDLERRVNSLNKHQLLYLYRERSTYEKSSPQIGETTTMPGKGESDLTTRIDKLKESIAIEGGATSDTVSRASASNRAVGNTVGTASPASASSPASVGAEILKNYKAEEDVGPTYYYYEDSKGEWRWRLKAANGRILADSAEGYKTEGACISGINRVKSSANAPVVRQ